MPFLYSSFFLLHLLSFSSFYFLSRFKGNGKILGIIFFLNNSRGFLFFFPFICDLSHSFHCMYYVHSFVTINSTPFLLYFHLHLSPFSFFLLFFVCGIIIILNNSSYVKRNQQKMLLSYTRLLYQHTRTACLSHSVFPLPTPSTSPSPTLLFLLLVDTTFMPFMTLKCEHA